MLVLYFQHCIVRAKALKFQTVSVHHQAAVQEEALPDGTVSTAEPRPSAYIPSDELPIPRPYGGHAPFKPSEPGTNMRHIRKPVPKPIEI